MSRSIRQALLAFLVAASPATAEEVRLSFGTTTAWETEISRGGGDDDLVWELRPGISVTGNHRRLSYALDYRPRIEIFTRFSELNDVGHRLSARASYQLDRYTSFQVTNEFSVLPSLRRLNEEILDEEGAPLAEGRLATEDILSNQFNATLSSQPFKRFAGTVGVSHFYREFEGASGNPLFGGGNRSAVTLSSSLDYVFSERMRTGVGFRWRRQETENPGLGFSSGDANLVSTSYHAFASWSYRPDPRTAFAVQVGPSYGEDDREGLDAVEAPLFPRLPGAPDRLLRPTGCELIRVGGSIRPILSPSCREVDLVNFPAGTFAQPALDEDQQDAVARLRDTIRFLPGEEQETGANLNLFATVSFSKVWERFVFSMSYTRSDSQTQGTGSATVVDSLATRVRWNPAPLWEASLRFNFTRRTTDLERGTPVTVLDSSVALVPGLTYTVAGTVVPFVGVQAVGLATLDSQTTFSVDTFSLRFQAKRQITRQLDVFGEARWRLDTAAGDFVREDVDRYDLRFGFAYRFETIRL